MMKVGWRAPLLCGEHLDVCAGVTGARDVLLLDLRRLALQLLDGSKCVIEALRTLRVRTLKRLNRGGVALALGTHAREKLLQLLHRRRRVRGGQGGCGEHVGRLEGTVGDASKRQQSCAEVGGEAAAATYTAPCHGPWILVRSMKRR